MVCCNLYSSSDIIKQIKPRRMRWAGHVAHMGEERKAYKVLMGKPEGKRPLGKLRHKWEDGTLYVPLKMCCPHPFTAYKAHLFYSLYIG
jgi:hypothetical protein